MQQLNTSFIYNIFNQYNKSEYIDYDDSLITNVNKSQFVNELKWNHPMLGVVLLSAILITIFGNTLVICAVIRERYLKSATNYYIVSLAVADLIVGLVVMPFNSLNKMTDDFWFFGDIW